MPSREAEDWLWRNADPKQPLESEEQSREPALSTLAVAVHGVPEQGRELVPSVGAAGEVGGRAILEGKDAGNMQKANDPPFLSSTNSGHKERASASATKPSQVSRAKADPTGATSHKRHRQLSSCGKCSKIHLTPLWELANFQPDCICATLTPFVLHRRRFSPSLIFIIMTGILHLQYLQILSRKLFSYLPCPRRNFGKQDQSDFKGPGPRKGS